MCWSTGKDSALALATARDNPDLEVVGLLTTVTAGYDRVSMHGVRRALLEAQARALGLPLHTTEIPTDCDNATYEARMSATLEAAKADRVEVMLFGDLFLEDVRAYRETMLEGTGIAPEFPLWQRPTPELAQELIKRGVVAHVTCLDPRVMPRELAGAVYDAAFLRALPETVDPCGENGEFHTFVSRAPGFAAPLDVQVGEAVERDGFVFTDLRPADSPGSKPTPAAPA